MKISDFHEVKIENWSMYGGDIVGEPTQMIFTDQDQPSVMIEFAVGSLPATTIAHDFILRWDDVNATSIIRWTDEFIQNTSTKDVSRILKSPMTRDIAELLIHGDTSSDDSFLSLFDGAIKNGWNYCCVDVVCTMSEYTYIRRSEHFDVTFDIRINVSTGSQSLPLDMSKCQAIPHATYPIARTSPTCPW